MSSDISSAFTAVREELLDLHESPTRWVFLVGSRPVVGVGLFVVFLVVFYALWAFGYVTLQNKTAMQYILSSLISGNLTLVTLVISINQVIISRQLNSPGELREDIQNVNEFRERAFDPDQVDVVPVTPSDFLKLLLESIRRDLQRLGGLTARADDDQLREDTDELVSGITDHVDEVIRLIEGTGSGTFDTLSALLTTNYADRIYQMRRLKSKHRDALSEETEEYVDDIVSTLQQLDVARQYFKTLYIQTELAYISRVLLYAGVVAELVLVSTLLTLTASGPNLPNVLPPVVAPLVAAIGLLPLAVLFSYAIRLAVVSQRTIAITPFTTPEQEEELNL
ncbi:hypothetical protein NDI76_05525 [Halogeometricum sp. S1BR25-6]|uniref:Uncharacterized protein n=1 Tax=Halogeometricum salsisoli TaxID=2950536 RepID=A0ABU2GDE6_9EURY|nr:hypothetical protein [Halogeometricum sp. S1BR25-6]MDS0298194.1 hypothetical protein [Halogeometricum sp. S1BR25-6]